LGTVAEDADTDAIEFQPWTVAPGTGTLTYTYMPADNEDTDTVDESLSAGAARWFRVIAITDENDGLPATGGTAIAVDPAAAAASTAGVPGDEINPPSANEASPEPEDITSAEEVRGVTEGAPEPEPDRDPGAPPAPADLTAERATDTNEFALTDRGVLLLWNEPTGGGDITSYEIERKIGDGEFEFVGQVTWTGDSDPEERTSFTDPRNPEDGDMLEYRVGSRSTSVGEATWADPVMYPAEHEHGTTLTKPTNVMAMSDAAGELSMTWEGADNADRYVLIAVDRSSIGSDSIEYKTEVVPDGAARTGTITGLTSGANYLGIVVAVQGSGSDMMVLYAVAAPPSVAVQ
jgi:hypothetical protein